MTPRETARELSRTTGMSYLEALTYLEVLEGLGVPPEAMYEAAATMNDRMHVAAEELARLIKPLQAAHPTWVVPDRRRITRRLLEAAWREGAGSMVERLAAPPQADTLIGRLRERHLARQRGPEPANPYPGGPVAWEPETTEGTRP